MILIDANILLYAENAASPFHKPARAWWDAELSAPDAVGLSWAVLNAFVRISTNPRVFPRPLLIGEAIARVDSWFKQPNVQIVEPTARHWATFRKLLADSQALANLVSDAHLAAIAIDHGCRLYSTDVDFARFKGLDWKNPLSSK